MTDINVHASRDFFNQISGESKRIQIAVHYIQTLLDQVKVRGSRVGDRELLTLVEHMESLYAVMLESSIRLEKICSQL